MLKTFFAKFSHYQKSISKNNLRLLEINFYHVLNSFVKVRLYKTSTTCHGLFVDRFCPLLASIHKSCHYNNQRCHSTVIIGRRQFSCKLIFQPRLYISKPVCKTYLYNNTSAAISNFNIIRPFHCGSFNRHQLLNRNLSFAKHFSSKTFHIIRQSNFVEWIINKLFAPQPLQIIYQQMDEHSNETLNVDCSFYVTTNCTISEHTTTDNKQEEIGLNNQTNGRNGASNGKLKHLPSKVSDANVDEVPVVRKKHRKSENLQMSNDVEEFDGQNDGTSFLTNGEHIFV